MGYSALGMAGLTILAGLHIHLASASNIAVTNVTLTPSIDSGQTFVKCDIRPAAPAPVVVAVEPLSPCGLVAEGGSGKVFLEWNPSLYDSVTAFHVYRAAAGGTFARITAKPLAAAVYVDSAVKPGLTYRYSLAGVTAGGKETERSPIATATPAAVADVKRAGNRFVFADGQQIQFDNANFKLTSWKSANGVELAIPTAYGNPLWLTGFDARGLVFPDSATLEHPVMTKPIGKLYRKAETPSVTVADGRVQVFYRIPLAGYGIPPLGEHDSWIWASVWETWYAVRRQIGPTVYQGIARKIELDVPTIYQDGFQLNLNDGFAFDGEINNAVSYRAQSWGSKMIMVHWDPSVDAAELKVRTSYEQPYHPDQNLLNVHPFLFVDHPKGTLIFTAQRMHYAVHGALSTYGGEGQKGLWPNLAIDLDNPGGRFAVETVEYLYSPDRNLQAPQRYIDARFHFLRRMADLYGMKKEFPGVSVYMGGGGYKLGDDMAMVAEREAERMEKEGTDVRHDIHRVWLEAPYGVPETLHNPDAPANRAIAVFNAVMKKHGLSTGFWMRAEAVQTARGNVMSDHFWTPYYGYNWQTLPPLIPVIEKQGFPLLRKHPEWMRLVKGGIYPDIFGVPEYQAERYKDQATAYKWSPMSLNSGWYDEVIYPALKMAGLLGFTSVFMDGGFGGFSGVEYTRGKATVMQPYWTRILRTMAHFGMTPNGECASGFGASFCFGPSNEKQHGSTIWMFAGCPLMGGGAGTTEQWMHRLHQLYAMPFDGSPNTARAHRFARAFVKKNGPPDRVSLEGLRLAGDAPDHWIYDKVVWEYSDGRKVAYPNDLPAER